MKYTNAIFLAILGGLTTMQGFAQARGGSNYAWYMQPDPSNCFSREPYGVIANYDQAQSQIDQQLNDMINAGQRRLRIPIFHGRGSHTGTVMDSTGGNLSSHDRTNLTNFLAAVVRAGFEEVEIGFFPQGPNDPTNWPAWSEDYFQENWNLIFNLRPIFVNSGVFYKLDLLNEGIPSSTQSILLMYCQKLWNFYVNTLGKNDTMGFSIIPDVDRLNQIPAVYGQSQFGFHGDPFLFEVHFNDQTSDMQSLFTTTHNTLNSLGYTQGWVIGETLGNDATEASQLRNAINLTGQTVFYIAQWPWYRSGACVAPPVAYASWINAGF